MEYFYLIYNSLSFMIITGSDVRQEVPYKFFYRSIYFIKRRFVYITGETKLFIRMFQLVCTVQKTAEAFKSSSRIFQNLKDIRFVKFKN